MVVVVVDEWAGAAVVDVDGWVVGVVEPEAEVVVVGWMTPSRQNIGHHEQGQTRWRPGGR